MLTPDDLLTFNATFLHAIFTDFYLPKGDGYAATKGEVPTDYTGNQLPYAAHETARLSYQHTFALNDRDSLIALAGTNFSSHYFTDYHDYAATSQDAYSRTDANLAWERRVEGWTFNTQFTRTISKTRQFSSVARRTTTPRTATSTIMERMATICRPGPTVFSSWVLSE